MPSYTDSKTFSHLNFSDRPAKTSLLSVFLPLKLDIRYWKYNTFPLKLKIRFMQTVRDGNKNRLKLLHFTTNEESSMHHTDYVTGSVYSCFHRIIPGIRDEVAMGIFADHHSPAQVIVPLLSLPHILFPTLILHFTDCQGCSCKIDKKRLIFVWLQ